MSANASSRPSCHRIPPHDFSCPILEQEHKDIPHKCTECELDKIIEDLNIPAQCKLFNQLAGANLTCLEYINSNDVDRQSIQSDYEYARNMRNQSMERIKERLINMGISSDVVRTTTKVDLEAAVTLLEMQGINVAQVKPRTEQEMASLVSESNTNELASYIEDKLEVPKRKLKAVLLRDRTVLQALQILISLPAESSRW